MPASTSWSGEFIAARCRSLQLPSRLLAVQGISATSILYAALTHRACWWLHGFNTKQLYAQPAVMQTADTSQHEAACRPEKFNRRWAYELHVGEAMFNTASRSEVVRILRWGYAEAMGGRLPACWPPR